MGSQVASTNLNTLLGIMPCSLKFSVVNFQVVILSLHKIRKFTIYILFECNTIYSENTNPACISLKGYCQINSNMTLVDRGSNDVRLILVKPHCGLFWRLNATWL